METRLRQSRTEEHVGLGAFKTVKHTSEPDRATELDYDDDDGDTNSGFVGDYM